MSSHLAGQDAELTQAKGLFAAGKRTEAKLLLERLTKRKEAPAEAFSILGMILMDPPFSTQRAAANEFQKAMQRNPNDLHGNLGAGILLVRSGKPVKALTFLERATKIAPKYPDARLQYGKALFQLNRLNEALVQFEASRSKVEAVEYLAIIESRRRRFTVAAKHVETLLTLLPKDSPERPRLFYQQGAILLLSSQNEAANALFQRSVDGGFVRAESLNELARFAYENGDLDKARGLYDRALKAPTIRPDKDLREARSTTLYALGLIAFKSKKYQEAADFFQRTIDKDRYHKNAWYKLGQSLQRLKKRDEAARALQFHKQIQPLHQQLKSVEISLVNDPSNAKNWLALSRLLLGLGRAKEAVQKLLILEQLDAEYPGLYPTFVAVAKELGRPDLEKRYQALADRKNKEKEAAK